MDGVDLSSDYLNITQGGGTADPGADPAQAWAQAMADTAPGDAAAGGAPAQTPGGLINPDVAHPGQVLFGREPADRADISPNDIHQNQIGDCYLDSTMGEMALRDPGAIRSMVHDNGDGTYTVTLHRQDNGLHNLWGLFGNDYADQKITVRPSNQPGIINSQQPDPVQVHGRHEMWPQVIEQAYAQQNGGYGKIGNGGWPSAAMQSLTGHDASETTASRYGFSQLQADIDAGKLVVLNTNTINPANNPLHLAGPHAYMATGTINTPQGQFVTLQNPWGNGTSGALPATLTVPYAQLQSYLTTASVGTTH